MFFVCLQVVLIYMFIYVYVYNSVFEKTGDLERVFFSSHIAVSSSASPSLEQRSCLFPGFVSARVDVRCLLVKSRTRLKIDNNPYAGALGDEEPSTSDAITTVAATARVKHSLNNSRVSL